MNFIDRLRGANLRARVLAGAPNLLELGAVSFGLQLHSTLAVFELFDEAGDLIKAEERTPTVDRLISFMHEKFSLVALVTSKCKSELAYFDLDNDYFVFAAGREDIDRVFRLDKDYMRDYFEDSIEGNPDQAHLRLVLKQYEPFF